MSKYAVMPMTDYEGICNAVRAKTGGTAKLKSSEVKQEIEGIQTGSTPVVQPLTVTENGTYTAPDGVDGYNPVTVNVAASGGDDGSLKAVIERTVTEITLPSDLTSIGISAFYNCTKLALTSLPDGITSIKTWAFYSCTNLALTSLPDGITSIDSNAFYNCTKLALTSLPDGITSISSSAFYNCTKLALTSLPAGVTSIGSNAFFRCSNLTEITFKGKPNSVHGSAFSGCTNLLTINVPWAEGEVSNAPWGATNATINYNYTGG